MKYIPKRLFLTITVLCSFYCIQVKLTFAANQTGRVIFFFRPPAPRRPPPPTPPPTTTNSPLPPPSAKGKAVMPFPALVTTPVVTLPLFPNAPVLTDVDYAASKRLKLSWSEAKEKCESSGLVLLVIYSEGDNQVLNRDPLLKTKPYSPKESFWSGARFTSAEYTTLMWEPLHKEFPFFMEKNANGIIKLWEIGEPADYSGLGKDVCIEMKFTGKTPPIWSASDCDDKNYFICVRPEFQRGSKLSPVVILADEEPTTTTIAPTTPNLIVNNDKFQTLSRKSAPPPTVLFPLANMEPKESGTLKGVDVAASANEKLTWSDAKLRCEESGLKLLVINTEASNQYLNSANRWIQIPYSRKERFWSGAKFTSTEYTKLMWEPTGEEILNFKENDGSGINKVWSRGEPYDDEGMKLETCVDMHFPGPSGGPPVWSASNCSEKRHFICVRPVETRSSKVNLLQVTIFNDILKNVVYGRFVIDRNPDTEIDGYMKNEDKLIFIQIDSTKTFVYPISGTWKPKDLSADVHGVLKQNDKLANNSAYFSTCSPCLDDKLLGEPGKFYSDAFPNRSVSGFSPIEAPHYFTPQDLSLDINRAQNGTWFPDQAHSPDNPFEVIHGEMQILEGQPVFKHDMEAKSIFIPDVTQIPLSGVLSLKEKVKSFTLKNTTVASQFAFAARGVPGYWRRLNGIMPKYPYSTIHGRLKGKDFESLSFVPDLLPIEGEFRVPEWVGPSISGGMSQGFPSLFRVTGKQQGLEKDEILGTFKPSANVSPNLPFRGVHGKLLTGNVSYQTVMYIPFEAFEKVSGVFVSDENPEEDISGEATQSNPSRFIPGESFKTINTSISGTWSPTGSYIQDDPNYYTHCVLKPSEDIPGTYVFVQDSLTPGIFKSTENPSNTIIGSISQGSMPVFRPQNVQKVAFNSITSGMWIPGTINGGFETPITGSFKPSKILPLNVYYFTVDESKSKK